MIGRFGGMACAAQFSRRSGGSASEGSNKKVETNTVYVTSGAVLA